MKSDSLYLSDLNESTHDGLIVSDNKQIMLTVREAECIKYMLSGMSAKQAARAMNISPRTVEFYIASVKNKFSCHKITYLFYKLAKLGLL